MSNIPCFTFWFTGGTAFTKKDIALENGVLILGEGLAKRCFDTFFPSDSMSSVRLRRIQYICEENLRKLPKTCSSKGALILIKTGTQVVENSLQGYSRSFKGTPFEIVFGRGVRSTNASEPSKHVDSLWFLMPEDEVLVVEQGNTSHTGIIVSWLDGELKMDKLPREYFSEE